jgi:hypothetical protein
MPRKFWRVKSLVIAAIIIALSISLVFATIGYFPHPNPQHNSITSPVTQTVPMQSGSVPGSRYVLIPLTTTENFAVGVNVTGGPATFCIIKEPGYQDWTPGTFDSFPWNSCVLHETTVKDTLTFTPTSTGNWDFVTLNTNPTEIIVEFTPA